MTRFLANENFPLASIRILRESGYDIAAIIETSPGITDEQVLAQAAQESRIILTFDRDYGDLIFNQGLPAPPGVLYLRFDPLTPEEPAEYIHQLLHTTPIILEDKFTVARRNRVRQRSL